MKVLLVGAFAPGSLERSYRSAFAEAGHAVEVFDFAAAVRRHVRFGAAGAYWNRFVPVEPWIARANRELVVAAKSHAPDVLAVVGPHPVKAGALAQVSVQTSARAVLIWPDTLLNLLPATIECLPLYDLIASYSEASVAGFARLGGRAQWIPLAADPGMHRPTRGADTAHLEADVGFIGGWRPERAATLARIQAELPEVRLRIWGPGWGQRRRGSSALTNTWQRRAPYEQDFARAVGACRINLNLIDPTNYPAANMRFFELPAAGGFQVSSACPEMAAQFRDGETVIYFESDRELPALLRDLLQDSERRMRIAGAARELIFAEHTYVHRARSILAHLAH